MIHFNLETMLALLVAYLLGAFIGCWLRKMFYQSASILHRQNEERPVVTGGLATSTAAAVGGASLSTYGGGDGEATVEISRARTQRETPVPPAPVPEPVEAAFVERETISFTEPEVVETEIVPKTVPKTVPVITDVKDVLSEPVVEQRAPVAPPPVEETVIEELLVPEAPQPAPEPVIDDLTRIKGVGLPTALELKKIGITRFEQVANWSDADVAEISERFGFSGRIERENWMDQAKILAAGDELEFTTHQLKEAEEGTAKQTSSSVQTFTSHTYSATSRSGRDDLRQITGIGSRVEQQLNELGISRLSQIADWSEDDVAAVSRQLGLEGRIELENWVEQAKKLVRRDV